jgi:hypothetical protein
MKSTKQHPKYWLKSGNKISISDLDVQVFARNMSPRFPQDFFRYEKGTSSDDAVRFMGTRPFIGVDVCPI